MQRSISDSVLASAPSICCSSAALASLLSLEDVVPSVSLYNRYTEKHSAPRPREKVVS